MDRREFLALTTIAAAGSAMAKTDRAPVADPGPQKPKPLTPGDHVAIVAPASPVESAKDLEGFFKRVRDLGLEPVPAPNLEKKYGFFGGTDQERADDLNWAFSNPDIKGILPVRGGYGCSRLLHLLDYKSIKKNPKALCGYSDITALHVALSQKAGLVTYHGPVLASSESAFSDGYLRQALFGSGPTEFKNPGWEYLNPQHPEVPPSYEIRALSPGRTTGRLAGGNLTLLAALCGTPYQLEGKNKIVFFEDVKEAPYRIDRMLTQLIHSGCFKGARGIVVGQFTDCDPEEPKEGEWLVADVLKDRLAPLGIPVMTGAAIGHITHKWTVPVGAMAELDADAGTLKIQ